MSNYKELKDWLTLNHARRLDTWPVQLYLVNGKTFLVMDMGADGWDVYTPVCPENNVEATLNALSEYVRHE